VPQRRCSEPESSSCDLPFILIFRVLVEGVRRQLLRCNCDNNSKLQVPVAGGHYELESVEFKRATWLFSLSLWPGMMEGQSLTKCRACGSTESTIWDADTGNAICPSCGTVEETQRLVSGEYYQSREQNAYSLGLFGRQGAANSYAVRIKGAEWHLQNHLVSLF
jgi:TFIIB zinc-binding